MIGNNARTWTFDDCTVIEDESNNCLEIHMERNGQVRTQIVNPADEEAMEACIADLEEGMSPVGAWEDGVGNLVCWENAEGEDEEEEFDETDARIIIDTPQGPRYIEVPDYHGESLWDAIAKYDEVNGTDLAERLEIDDILAAGQESTAYSCGPLDYEDLSWPFSFVRFDGNSGDAQGFLTIEEAEAEAEMIWDHMTSEERAAYSEPGCYFAVIEGEITEDGDIGKVLRDFTEDIGEDEEARDQILRMVGELVLMGLSTMEALAWACTRAYDHQDALIMMERLAGRPVPDQVARNYIHRAKSKLKG